MSVVGTGVWAQVQRGRQNGGWGTGGRRGECAAGATGTGHLGGAPVSPGTLEGGHSFLLLLIAVPVCAPGTFVTPGAAFAHTVHTVTPAKCFLGVARHSRPWRRGCGGDSSGGLQHLSQPCSVSQPREPRSGRDARGRLPPGQARTRAPGPSVQSS